ncbi:DUF3040 domain-containing protein [Actinoplanes sp. GCM10030250]|uniref:DUF3040 domain-containing protein n=1 Tax=Actinoplanes sp. GCM10030250 TaxID=3273376 RepID=UPI003611E9AC
MLEPREDQAFRGVIAQLLIDDVSFAQRINRLGRPPRWWAVLAVALWAIGPICIVLGGWTGFFEAVLAAGYGTHLLRKRQRWTAAAARVTAGGPPAPLG